MRCRPVLPLRGWREALAGSARRLSQPASHSTDAAAQFVFSGKPAESSRCVESREWVQAAHASAGSMRPLGAALLALAVVAVGRAAASSSSLTVQQALQLDNVAHRVSDDVDIDPCKNGQSSSVMFLLLCFHRRACHCLLFRTSPRRAFSEKYTTGWAQSAGCFFYLSYIVLKLFACSLVQQLRIFLTKC